MQRRSLLQCAGGAGFALLTQILRQRMASGNERVVSEAKSSRQVAAGFGRAKSVAGRANWKRGIRDQTHLRKSAVLSGRSRPLFPGRSSVIDCRNWLDWRTGMRS
jgi:hypothetical protein